MSLNEKFFPIQNTFYKIIDNFFKKTAGLFGYPENPGMPVTPEVLNEIQFRSRLIDNLPNHKTFWPPIQRPETWFEMVLGPTPKVEIVPRYSYESKSEGFYNFYIENYKNIYFFPDWLSEFIQVRLHICLDLTVLETIREILFVGLVVYSQIVILRIALSWFISINPYSVPWCYLAAAVDWTEDILQGIVPAILGINITGSIFLGILGLIADSLNHVVFTMPFLPSEGEGRAAHSEAHLPNIRQGRVAGHFDPRVQANPEEHLRGHRAEAHLQGGGDPGVPERAGLQQGRRAHRGGLREHGGRVLRQQKQDGQPGPPANEPRQVRAGAEGPVQ